MEDAGVINGYKTIVSPFETGYQLKAIITLRAFMGRLKPFLETVKSFDEVVNCYRITGNENIDASWELINLESKIGISETGSFQTNKINLWGWKHVISPELFFNICLKPDQSIE